MTPHLLPHVAVVMAVHKPDKTLLATQLESYRRQQGVNTSLFALLDGEETCADQAVVEELRRFGAVLIEERSGVGVRRAFLTALAEALEATAKTDALFAFMDQDDRWHDEKLSVSVRALCETNAQLVHCDARVITAEGQLVAPSVHALENRQRGESLLGQVLLNTVTGMTAVFTRTAAQTCLNLEQGLESTVLHDHLMAVAAVARGRITFVDRVMLDYVSHGRNAVGPVQWQTRPYLAREFSMAALSRYSETTSRVFRDRQSIVYALFRNELAPKELCAVFLVGDAPPSFWRLTASYLRGIRQMKREGRARCGRWLMRFYPLAIILRL